MASKYNVSENAAKRTYEGITYDSELEMRYFRDVISPMMASGAIVRCEWQPRYELQPKFKHDDRTIRAVVYVADFALTYADGRREVIDVKGMPTAEARLKRKLFMYRYPDIDLRWITYVKRLGGWIPYDKARARRK